MWRSFAVLKIRVSKIRFYLTFGFLGFKVVKKQTIFLKLVKILDFRILSGWIEKYKPALMKSDSSWDNSYCVRLVIVLLVLNISKLQSLVSEDNFLCITISAEISCYTML